MRGTAPKSLFVSLLVAASIVAAPGAHAQPVGATDRDTPYLTGPSVADPLDIAMDAVFGIGRSAWAGGLSSDEFELAHRARSDVSGVTRVILGQRIDGLEVWRGDILVNVNRDGRVIDIHDGSASAAGFPARSAWSPPLLDVLEVLRRAASQLGLVADETLEIVSSASAPSETLQVSSAGLSQDLIPARLMWLPGRYLPEAPNTAAPASRRVWNVVIRPPGTHHAWELNLDAETGEVLTQVDWIRSESYRAYEFPIRSPDEGDRSLLADPADPAASPYGWHDVDGAPGLDFVDSRGNNVHAQADPNGNDLGLRSIGGVNLLFDFSLDLDADADQNRNAAVTNAFYWTNRLHDILYRYGFDEANGNFQVFDNGKPGGSASPDPLLADVMDGAVADNSFFFTPNDGFSPRMELGLFTNVGHVVRVVSPAELAGDYPASGATFGPELTSVGTAGRLVAAEDVQEEDGTSLDACSTLTNPGAVAGNIAFVDRGGCFFVDKVANAEAAGAIAVLVVNKDSNLIFTMGLGDEPDSASIPVAMLGLTNGERVRSFLDQGVDVILIREAESTVRDAAFSSDIIVHEYFHGVTNRLTGGPGNSSCLGDAHGAAMGEGWSDFASVMLLASAEDSPHDPHPVGTWVLDEPPGGGGIRAFAYSADMDINPRTYASFTTPPGLEFQEHRSGEVWAVVLLELYWKLVAEYGFDPDYTEGYEGVGGNGFALQLVMEGLKLQPCEPTMIEARNAILAAEQELTAGENRCLVWGAFARRGLGVDASDGGGSNSTAVLEDFHMPVGCPEPDRGLLFAGALAVLLVLRRRRMLAVPAQADGGAAVAALREGRGGVGGSPTA